MSSQSFWKMIYFWKLYFLLVLMITSSDESCRINHFSFTKVVVRSLMGIKNHFLGPYFSFNNHFTFPYQTSFHFFCKGKMRAHHTSYHYFCKGKWEPKKWFLLPIKLLATYFCKGKMTAHQTSYHFFCKGKVRAQGMISGKEKSKR